MNFEDHPTFQLLLRSPELLEPIVRDLACPTSEQADQLICVAITLLNRFDMTQSIGDLDRAIVMAEQANVLLPNDYSGRPLIPRIFSLAFSFRFDCTGSKEDLDLSIVFYREALTTTLESDPKREVLLNDLGHRLRHRFERTRSHVDLTTAIELFQNVFSSTTNTFLKAVASTNLGLAFHNQFEQSGSMNDLTRAIDMAEAAVDILNDNEACIAHLGMSLVTRFEETGNVDDLDRAIAIMQPFINSKDRNSIYTLYNFYRAILRRYERTGLSLELEQALCGLESAEHSLPKTHPFRHFVVNLLSHCYDFRFTLTDSLEDLNRAIELQQVVVDLTEGFAHSSVFLLNLCSTLSERFERTGAIQDIDRAIEIGCSLLTLTDNNQPVRVVIYNELYQFPSAISPHGV
jgi:tetratricopeptide (TPR) repeat protein